ncbi:MAG: hypothetical protein JNL18_22990 [Planctomycetaceae bacterium]|nr:hypothetical protein [Planctomycetaceae bacterium]
MEGPLTVTVEYADRSFDFSVYRRELGIGRQSNTSQEACRYYWMDTRQFRQGVAGPNFRLCVDFWWTAVETAGYANDEIDQETLVLAECYPLVNTARSMQEIYVDAHLRANADREFVWLDDGATVRRASQRIEVLEEDEVARLQSLAERRDPALIQQELEKLFLGSLPAAAEQSAFDEAAQTWLNNGIDALVTRGREGLRQYVGEVDQWNKLLRKRGGIGKVRQFLNLFSYECKMAFYTCYASAWVGILNTLSTTERDNPLGHRLMRLWHNQNRPADGAGRDAFCGQILALHPLSSVMLTSPEHLESIRQWIALPDYNEVAALGAESQQAEYWQFCGSILLAAAQYHRSRDRAKSLRSIGADAAASAEPNQSTDNQQSVAAAIEDFLASRGEKCECAGQLAYLRHTPISDDPNGADVAMACKCCGRESAWQLDRAEFARRTS